jgi:hypothetical protein
MRELAVAVVVSALVVGGVLLLPYRRGSRGGVPARHSPFERNAPETLPICAACRAMSLPE